MSLAALLLAGGYSRRMGSDKASLPWGNSTLLKHQADTLRATGAREWLLSCRSEQEFTLHGFKRVTDTEPGGGPMAALANAWNHTQAEVLLVLAVDLPLVPAVWLKQLAILADREGQSILPAREAHYEPLSAAWHRSCLPHMHFALNSKQRSFRFLCTELATHGKLRKIVAGEKEAGWLTNLNRPVDLAAAQ
jgi:molybdenum cofactor guanylyltransferase